MRYELPSTSFVRDPEIPPAELTMNVFVMVVLRMVNGHTHHEFGVAFDQSLLIVSMSAF
jgi:hypothetical protein